MEKHFMNLWEKNKNKLEDYFKTHDQREYSEYKNIVEKIIELVINDEEFEYYETYNIKRMTVIDDGDYQGTEIFMIPRDAYQPDAEDYIFTHNYYGSCCGCDTLQAINCYELDEKPSERQLKDYMLLSLNLVENLRYLVPREGE